MVHRLDYVPHYWGAQRVYWGVLRPRIRTQKVKSMLGWRGLHWRLTLRGGMKFMVYVEILSSERNKEELSGFDSIEFVGISLEKYQDRCGIISGIIFAGR